MSLSVCVVDALFDSKDLVHSRLYVQTYCRYVLRNTASRDVPSVDQAFHQLALSQYASLRSEVLTRPDIAVLTPASAGAAAEDSVDFSDHSRLRDVLSVHHLSFSPVQSVVVCNGIGGVAVVVAIVVSLSVCVVDALFDSKDLVHSRLYAQTYCRYALRNTASRDVPSVDQAFHQLALSQYASLRTC